MEKQFYSYVSTKAGCDPVKTIFLCVPQEYAGSLEQVEAFAISSGWQQQVEEDASLLIAPLCEDWKTKSIDDLYELYDKYRNDFKAPSGKSIPGRDGIVWTWETMIFLVGYQEGAMYAGEVLVKYPNMFSATMLYEGWPQAYTSKDEPTTHWFVKEPKDYAKTNQEIPSTVWFCANELPQGVLNYFKTCAHCDKEEVREYENQKTIVYYDSENEAKQVRYSKTMVLSQCVMDTFFNHIIRWKNSPDGELRTYLGKKDYALSKRFQPYEVSVNGFTYPYTVYLPEGMTKEDVKGLPIVFSIHGRGEPTWVFAEKNGWHALADQTKEFIVVFPDSPDNIWTIERDQDAIPTIANKVIEDYEADASRVYLTGFSNGAIYTCQLASTYPELFAAASPWNGPGLEACKVAGIASYVYHNQFQERGYEMPFWIIVGDSDSKASSYRDDELEILFGVNHCSKENNSIRNKENYYTNQNGYQEGVRFHTTVYYNEEKVPMIGLTIMKNMPHGAIWEESKAAWTFMKDFSRQKDNKKIAWNNKEEK